MDELTIGHLNFCKVPEKCTCYRKTWIDLFQSYLSSRDKKLIEKLEPEAFERVNNYGVKYVRFDKVVSLIQASGEEKE